MATCSVCSKDASRRGMCGGHYRRWLKYGDPLGGVRAHRCRNGAPLSWIKANAAKEHGDNCLLWPFAKGRLGYGYNLVFNAKEYQPHALMNKLANSEPPLGKTITRHTCHNPSCINPRHLLWGDHADNMADMASAGRSVHGERHLSAKLTEKDVRDILASDLSAYALAPTYGVAPSTIVRVRSGKNWKHLRKESA